MDLKRLMVIVIIRIRQTMTTIKERGRRVGAIVLLLATFPPGGGVLNKVLYGEALPRVPNPYPFNTIFDRKGTPFAYLPSKIVPLSYTYGATFSKLFYLRNPLKYLDESAVRCVCSRYFYSPFTSAREIPPLVYPSNLKKVPLLGGASPYSPL